MWWGRRRGGRQNNFFVGPPKRAVTGASKIRFQRGHNNTASTKPHGANGSREGKEREREERGEERREERREERGEGGLAAVYAGGRY